MNVSTLSAITFQNDEFHKPSSVHTMAPARSGSTANACSKATTAARSSQPCLRPCQWTTAPVLSPSARSRFYWLAVHEPTWQVYTQCVPITLGV